MPKYGHIEPFELNGSEKITDYVERFEQYLVANDIADEAKKTAVFLSIIGAETYSLLKTLIAPDPPSGKRYSALKETLVNHLVPKPILIAERYKFYHRKQEDGESLTEFISALRKLTENCEFGDFLSDALRDRFVCGIRNPKTRRLLLTKRDLDLQKALDIGRSLEKAEHENEIMQETNEDSCAKKEALYELKHPREKRKCYRCNDESHLAPRCRFKDSICSVCKKKGHIDIACRSKGKQNQKPQNKWHQGKGDRKSSVSKCNHVHSSSESDRNDDDDDDEIYYIHKIKAGKKPYKIKLNVNSKPVNFEIDTGAGITVVSKDTFSKDFKDQKLKPSKITVKTYSNEIIPVAGECYVTVLHGDKTYENLKLVVLEGDGVSLLGRNWLNKIQVDWNSVIRDVSQNKMTSQTKKSFVVNDQLNEMFKKYSSIFEDKLGKIEGYQASIHVKGDTTPKYSKARNVPFALEQAVTNELERLEKEDVLESIPFSEWASPIVIVPKPDGKIRLCGDFKRTVNPCIENEEYHIPTPDEIFNKVQGGELFSKIDLQKAYLQLELDNESRKYLVINTHKGLKRYKRMPYGIKPATAIFQRYMENILCDVPMVAVRVDDIIISGKGNEEHLCNLRKVLEILKEAGVTVKKEKCKFFLPQVEYMGFIISRNGVMLDESKTEAVRNSPAPRNLKELQSFLGGINYYSKFIPKMAEIAKPLYDLLAKNCEWKWEEKHESSFRTLKEKLTVAPILTIYDPSLPVKLDCDASKYGLGAVLSNIQPDGTEKPIAYVSRTLNKNEQNYSQVEKEGLSIIFGLKKFNQFLYGRHFTLCTDCKALSSIFHPHRAFSVIAASRLIRWSLILYEYDYEIQYRATDKHSNADMLSRLPLKDTKSESPDNLLYNIQIGHLPVSSDDIRNAIHDDPILREVIDYVKNDSWPSKMKRKHRLYPYYVRRDELLLQNDILLWGLRVVIPKSAQKEILNELHSQHPGVVRMKGLSRIHVWFPGIDDQVESIVSKCIDCQKVANEPSKSCPHPWAWPSGPMDRVHLDFFGPFLQKTCLLMVDSYSGWGEVDVMKNTNAPSTVSVLRNWFARYGLPNQIVSDNGPQFISKEFSNFCKMNGIKHVKTPRYHQSSNGEAERLVQTIKKGLKKNRANTKNFQERLDNYLFAYRNTPSTSTGLTPAELFLGRRMKCKMDLIKPSKTNEIKKNRKNTDETPVRKFVKGQNVFVRNHSKNNFKRWTPATIVGAIGSKCYEVDVNGKMVKVHIDHLLKNNTDQKDSLDDYLLGASSDDDVEVEPQRPRYPTRLRRPVDRYGYSPRYYRN